MGEIETSTKAAHEGAIAAKTAASVAREVVGWCCALLEGRNGGGVWADRKSVV